ncbi:MAG: peptidylprolyl isomerase [Candidatus Limivivens sp.]|nr:peptidylprolyl isomerase [Candidatus Limivivens sp.]
MENQVLAIVAGEEITQETFEAFLQTVPREQRAYLSNPEARQYYLDQLVSLYLFAKDGEEQKLDETEAYQKMIANARRDILAQMAMRQALKDVTVPEEEMKKFYEENRQQFTKGGTVRAKHILTETEEKCLRIRDEIETGAKAFEIAAQEYSTCPSGQKGGDLGEFGRGQMVKEFEQAAFEGEIGKVVGPVKTQFGYHLIKVESRSEASAMPYEEARETIRRTLLQKKQNEAYSAKIAALKAKYEVK